MNWFDPAVWQESGGLYGLIVLALFVLIFVDRAMVAKANARLVSDLIRILYEQGHLPDRRKKDWWQGTSRSEGEGERRRDRR